MNSFRMSSVAERAICRIHKSRSGVTFWECFVISMALLSLLATASRALAHDDDKIKKLPPTKAKADLVAARLMLDAAKRKLIESGRYSCCVKAPPGSKVAGCDLCVRLNGSCNCAENLRQGKGVCGECLAGWKTGRGAVRGVNAKSVTLLSGCCQAKPGAETASPPAEIAQARDTLNRAKRTLVQETRYACCIGDGGCDECAFEASCPCARRLAEGQKGKGVCGQCYDGLHVGKGRIPGLTAADAKLDPLRHGAMEAFAGIPHAREASGTAWQPDSSPIHAFQRSAGPWSVMAHYNAYLAYDRQSGPRGDDQVNSLNWAMLMASRPTGKGELMFRAMLSLEPATVGPRGYPLLFQTGETYGGRPLVDRQHPHDLFMEAAARYRYQIGPDTAISLYAAPSGEPALGPVAYPHRVSAANNPITPLSHHWQDSTHITFGVVTAGLSRGNAQIEGSSFTGRAPDEHRWNFDPVRLGSFSGRLTLNPGRHWSLQASYAYIQHYVRVSQAPPGGALITRHGAEPIDSPNPVHAERRTTFSATYNQPLTDGRNWASTLVWGRSRAHKVSLDALLLESNLELKPRIALFGRAEHVFKAGGDLALAPFTRVFPITQATLGGVYELTPGRPYETALGFAVTRYWKPASLAPVYGTSNDGLWLFLRIRPRRSIHGE